MSQFREVIAIERDSTLVSIPPVVSTKKKNVLVQAYLGVFISILLVFVAATTNSLFMMITAPVSICTFIASAIALHNISQWVKQDCCCNLVRHHHPAYCTRIFLNSGKSCCCSSLAIFHMVAATMTTVAVLSVVIISVLVPIDACSRDGDQQTLHKVVSHNSSGMTPFGQVQQYFANISTELGLAIHTCTAVCLARVLLIIVLTCNIVLLMASFRLLRPMEIELPEIPLIPEDKMVIRTYADPDDIAPDFVFSKIRENVV